MLPAGREAGLDVGARVYVRHRSERTLLYQIVDEYYPAFKQHLEAQEAYLPGYVEQEFEGYLKCGRLEHGFLRVRCESCHAEHLVALSCVSVAVFVPAAAPAAWPKAPPCWWTRCFPRSRSVSGC